MVIQDIVIGTCHGAEARMKVLYIISALQRFRGSGPAYSDGRRQKRIDAAYPGKNLTLEFGIEMHHLLDRMHSGIRTPGACNGAFLLREGLERRLQAVLHGMAGRLRLPAMPLRAVILHAQYQSIQFESAKN